MKKNVATSLNDWLYNPRPEDGVCYNKFHRTCLSVFRPTIGDPWAPDPEATETKVAQLLMNMLILLDGDAIFVREGTQLHPLGEALSLLAYYMHSDTREARRAADLLESNFMGYFPVTSNDVSHNQMELVYDALTRKVIDISSLEPVEQSLLDPVLFPEYGESKVCYDNREPLAKFFALVNQAVGDRFFAERMLMYPFRQPYREKSHVLVGSGGNGKSMFMRMVQTLYGERALTDAPQPNFRGHDPQVISYGFIGKRVVTFNDVGDPSAQFLEWLKRMITGNLEVKTPSGAWLSVPCQANFFMETNHKPQFLDLEAHRRRFVMREFDEGFKLANEMSPAELDRIGERGDLTAGDIVNYLMSVKDDIDKIGWTDFSEVK